MAYILDIGVETDAALSATKAFAMGRICWNQATTRAVQARINA
jgi:hypothetical protein